MDNAGKPLILITKKFGKNNEKNKFQQTITSVIDSTSGNIITAENLLEMKEDELRKPRRASLDNIKNHNSNPELAQLKCAICLGPVHI